MLTPADAASPCVLLGPAPRKIGRGLLIDRCAHFGDGIRSFLQAADPVLEHGHLDRIHIVGRAEEL